MYILLFALIAVTVYIALKKDKPIKLVCKCGRSHEVSSFMPKHLRENCPACVMRGFN